MDSAPRDVDSFPENWTHAGRVLRNVTHDLNNHLGAILAFAELIAMGPARPSDTVGMAKEIAAAVRDSNAQLDTVAAIVSDDLTTIETIHLNELLPRIVSLFRYELDRGDSGIDLALPREVCAFPGVRTRMVRAIAHVIRHIADTMDASKAPRRVTIQLTAQQNGFTIEIGGNSSIDALPAALAEAAAHIRHHSGELRYARPGSIRIDIPRDTKLLKPGAISR